MAKVMNAVSIAFGANVNSSSIPCQGKGFVQAFIDGDARNLTVKFQTSLDDVTYFDLLAGGANFGTVNNPVQYASLANDRSLVAAVAGAKYARINVTNNDGALASVVSSWILTDSARS
jgi:hypothetical protein